MVELLEEKNFHEKEKFPEKNTKKLQKKRPEIKNSREKKVEKKLEKQGIYGIKNSQWWNSWRKKISVQKEKFPEKNTAKKSGKNTQKLRI